MIKAIIFDFGGPIVDQETGMKSVYQKHDDLNNLEHGTLKKLFGQYVNGGHTAEFQNVTDFIEKTKPSINMTVEALNEVFNEVKSSQRIRPEMIVYIEELKKKYKIAILSNAISGLEETLQDVLQIYHLFDLVVSSYNLKIQKPDPRIYNHTLKKLGIQAQEAVFIDDVVENVRAAEALGIRGVVFKDFEQCRFDLNKILHCPMPPAKYGS